VSIGDIFTADDAKRLKETMAEAKKVIVLATPENAQFPLITWETGLADQMKGFDNVAVLPVVHQNRSWEKRDVLQLYSRIEKPENDWMVLSPGYDFKGMTFAEWLDK
jgi:hypothetical protein